MRCDAWYILYFYSYSCKSVNEPTNKKRFLLSCLSSPHAKELAQVPCKKTEKWKVYIKHIASIYFHLCDSTSTSNHHSPFKVSNNLEISIHKQSPMLKICWQLKTRTNNKSLNSASLNWCCFKISQSLQLGNSTSQRHMVDVLVPLQHAYWPSKTESLWY